jgi:hypothetical protein
VLVSFLLADAAQRRARSFLAAALFSHTPDSRALTAALPTVMRRALRAVAAALGVAAARHAHAQQVTIGSGASLSASGFVRVTSTATPCTLSDGTAASCLQVTSQALPDHAMGPWCDGAYARRSVARLGPPRGATRAALS